MYLKHITKCRGCGNTDLINVVDLGEMHIQGAFKKLPEHNPPTRLIPNKLVRCNAMLPNTCGLVQTSVSVPPEILYSSYWYRSGISNTMKSWLKYISDEAVKWINPHVHTPRVLDIAANDLTLLRNYPPNYTRVGVDPSNIIIEAAEKNPEIKIINGLFPQDLDAGSAFDVITSIAVFYDIENPIDFISSVKHHLSNNGLWIFEVAYLPTMIENLSYDSICCEHITHYSLSSIEWLLKRAGMKLIRADKTDTNGGSILCFAVKQELEIPDSYLKYKKSLQLLRNAEFDLELEQDTPYRNFRYQLAKHKDEIAALIKSIADNGKTIHLYGASTKINTLLEYCDIARYIKFASERSEEKWGAETLNGIKIISEEESREMRPDYYLVGPYHFKSEILARESDALSKGTRFIFPLPKLTVV